MFDMSWFALEVPDGLLLRAEYSTEAAFRFRHVLIRDAAYARVPKKLRAELHERFARWLEERALESAPEEELVGYHLEQAVRYQRELGRIQDEELAGEASRLLTVAGLRAAAREDASAAANLLDRAASLLDDPGHELLLELGEALRDSGELGRAKAVFRYRACAPSFEQETVTSTKPRWLRHMIATPSPSPMPASERACASALVRRCISSKVTVPSSSTIATSWGLRIAALL